MSLKDEDWIHGSLIPAPHHMRTAAGYLPARRAGGRMNKNQFRLGLLLGRWMAAAYIAAVLVHVLRNG